ncbi:B12-binding domain-containing radical SAM protein [Baaleninema simplex]|uniref:B12-binding domain-containing radical SAM protein n=1 Tax=Baaleninema simplex TaxID=2862350 RepID=UPI000349C480|nr:B12-binding domain-containing radical SAM protein [Baaleninema simplex]
MRVLLLYPRFPKSFWSFDKAMELVGRKAVLPPLGLITVAAILPDTWELKLVDLNVRPVEESEWDWAELVILSGMIVQKDDMMAQIQHAQRRGKPVAVGGPYPTSLPEELEEAGADFLVLDEGEITLPMFVEAIERGDTRGVFRATEKPAVTETPIPRYDLLELDAYDNMSVQFSRGCPFQCEFCDIIVLYGRKPRTKNPEQLLAELDTLYELGWRGSVFLVDDNFIGNKRNVKLLLRAIKPWMKEHQYPFHLSTEASVDLAQDAELMDLMADCNFNSVFLGIETPDADSLALTKKFQNTRDPLTEAVGAINAAGMRVMAGFIIGFDGEKPGAGDRIVEFVEQTAIPQAMVSMLQVLPNTALMERLKKEGRLLEQVSGVNQTTLMNFIPTRPIEDIANEYVDAFYQLYDPVRYQNRVYRHYISMSEPRHAVSKRGNVAWKDIRALLTIAWRQGVLRPTRWTFWRYLADVYFKKPRLVISYLATCALSEHFIEYREMVRHNIEAQLEAYLKAKSNLDESSEKPVPVSAGVNS